MDRCVTCSEINRSRKNLRQTQFISDIVSFFKASERLNQPTSICSFKGQTGRCANPLGDRRACRSLELTGSRCVNLFIAAVLAGFGSFVAVYLGNRGWSQQDIGFVLSAAEIAGLLSQIPGASS